MRIFIGVTRWFIFPFLASRFCGALLFLYFLKEWKLHIYLRSDFREIMCEVLMEEETVESFKLTS